MDYSPHLLSFGAVPQDNLRTLDLDEIFNMLEGIMHKINYFIW